MYEKEEKKKGQSHVSWWKVFLVLAICLSGILLPISGIAANTGVQTINRDITVLRPGDGNTWNKTNGKILYFGNPTAASAGYGFRVLNSSPDTQNIESVASGKSLFLDCDGAGWNIGTGSNRWENSDFRSYLKNSYYNGSSIFSDLEKSLIAETTLFKTLPSENMSIGGWAMHDPSETKDYVFMLSLKEESSLYQNDANTRTKSNRPRGFLRTSSSQSSTVMAGLESGRYDAKNVVAAVTLSPAFNLDTTDPSILFASENANNKTSALAAPAS
ncbi:MAG: DUF6273 domain-containing protein, partial [Clostridiales bacterium]|nr:DUF6273 domain-containing protein [Clostridiales bacterium]